MRDRDAVSGSDYDKRGSDIVRLQSGALIVGLLGLSVMPLSAPLAGAPKTEHYELFVLNDPASGKEEEFNRWYDLQHAQDVLINPTYTTSQRFVLNDMQMPGSGEAPTKYLIRFKIETADIAKTLSYIHDNIKSGRTIMTNTIGRGKGPGGDFVYKAVTNLMPGKSPSARGGRADAGFIQVVFSSAVPGQEAQFNSRYDSAIASKLAAVPNLVRWQRFKTSPTQLTVGHPAMAQDYMTIYELNPRDITQLVAVRRIIADAEASALSGVGKVGASITYRAIGPILLGTEVKRERAAAGANYKPAVPPPAGGTVMGGMRPGGPAPEETAGPAVPPPPGT